MSSFMESHRQGCENVDYTIFDECTECGWEGYLELTAVFAEIYLPWNCPECGTGNEYVIDGAD